MALLVKLYIKNADKQDCINKKHELMLYIENANKRKKEHDKKISYPIYYINMDKDIERKKLTENELSKISNNFKRISGVVGKNIQNKRIDTVQGISFVNDYSKMSVSEIGCILSHIKAIQTSYDNGDSICLIVEDDVMTDTYKFSESIESLVSKAPCDWEILQLFSGKTDEKQLEYNLNFILYNGSWSTLSYLINRSGMKKILSVLGYPYHIKKIRKDFPTSGVADNWIYSIVNTYIVYPYLFIPNTFVDSTIHNEHIELIHVPSVDNFLKRLNDVISPKNNLIFIDKYFDTKFISHIFPNNFITTKKSEASVIVDNISSKSLSTKYKVPKIIIDMEPKDDSKIKNADLVITTKKYPKHNFPYIYVPQYSMSFAQHDFSPNLLLEKNRNIKKKFCAFVCPSNVKVVKKEEDFYILLQEMSNNRVENVATDNISEYKFVICFEKENLNGYITEKLTNAMLSGCIPIYSGSEDVSNHFNSNSFVN